MSTSETSTRQAARRKNQGMNGNLTVGRFGGVELRLNWSLLAVVATGDKAAGTDLTRSMAERAGATITELDGSHVIMVSQPEAVADVIMTAIAAVDRATVHA